MDHSSELPQNAVVLSQREIYDKWLSRSGIEDEVNANQSVPRVSKGFLSFEESSGVYSSNVNRENKLCVSTLKSTEAIHDGEEEVNGKHVIDVNYFIAYDRNCA